MFKRLRQLFNRVELVFGPTRPAPAPVPPSARPKVVSIGDRSLEDMVFCTDAKPTCLDLLEEYVDTPEARIVEMWNDIHKDKRNEVRKLLRSLGVEKAGDIATLGCTGAIAKGASVERTNKLITDLAGSGAPLPCFVPSTRFCLVHNTIGGLQDGQKALHVEHIAAVSRELTVEEKGKMELMEASRRVRGENLDARIAATIDTLSGRDMPKGFEFDGEKS